MRSPAGVYRPAPTAVTLSIPLRSGTLKRMRHNRLRELLRAGTPSLGTHVISPWPAIYEVVGRSGAFDYVEFVAEEAPFDLHDLDGIGRAVELFPDMGAMIKVDAALRDFTAARAVNAGFDSVLFADIRTADDARAAVRCVRPETPADSGGLGSTAALSGSAAASTPTTCRRCVTWSSR